MHQQAGAAGADHLGDAAQPGEERRADDPVPVHPERARRQVTRGDQAVAEEAAGARIVHAPDYAYRDCSASRATAMAATRRRSSCGSWIVTTYRSRRPHFFTTENAGRSPITNSKWYGSQDSESTNRRRIATVEVRLAADHLAVAGLLQVPGRAQQGLLEVLPEQADGSAGGVRHVVGGAQVDHLAGLEAEHRGLLGVVGVERHLLLERHPLLLGEGQHAGLAAVRGDGVHLVLVDHEPDALAHDELLLGLKGIDCHGRECGISGRAEGT